MVSLRFPFSFSQSRPPNSPATSRFRTATVCSAAVAAGVGAIAAGVSLSQNNTSPLVQNTLEFLINKFTLNYNDPIWGSLSLAAAKADITESKTGVSFPAVLKDSQQLLGVGLRKKSVMGLKSINVYAFGVYADESDVKKCLAEKYGSLSVSQLKEKDVNEDLMESDVCMTVRLQIVYGRLSIRSVRNAFEESVGDRLQKFGGSDNKELLQRFTSQFKDDIKIPRGSTIDLSKERGYVLRTKIDGKEVGSIQSKLLCHSILDLYIGDAPFDQQVRDNLESNLAPLLND
ncbi:hypothetical protein ACET3Z_002493 [Daucus carota]